MPRPSGRRIDLQGLQLRKFLEWDPGKVGSQADRLHDKGCKQVKKRPDLPAKDDD